MASAIELALQHINFNIPNHILRLAFTDSRFPSATIEDNIKNLVLYQKVMTDCNLVGGRYKLVTLLKTNMVSTPPDTNPWNFSGTQGILYRIPPEERDYVDIMSVIGLVPFGYLTAAGFPIQSIYSSDMVHEALNLIRAYTGDGFIPKPHVDVVGVDIIRIYPSTVITSDWVAGVNLAYDTEFTNMQVNALQVFRELVLEAVKMFIWTNQIVIMEQGRMQFGTALEAVQSIIEGYSDANEKYLELLEKFSGAVKMSPERIERLAQFMI